MHALLLLRRFRPTQVAKPHSTAQLLNHKLDNLKETPQIMLRPSHRSVTENRCH
jgi:hypothetical protein